MTFELDPGPGDDAYRSTTFSATVPGGSQAFVYQFQRGNDTSGSTLWEDTDTPIVSWFSCGTDNTVVLTVSTLSGVVNTAVVSFRGIGSYTVAGGVLLLTMAPNTDAFIRVNGDDVNPLCVFVGGLDPTAPVGATEFDGGQTSVTDGNDLVFPAGVWTIGQKFPVGSDCVVHFERGSWVIGSFDITTTTGNVKSGIRFQGSGNLSGEWQTDVQMAAIRALASFDDQSEYSAIVGYGTGKSNDYFSDNILSELCIVGSPFISIYAGITEASHCRIINPWYVNSDAFHLGTDTVVGNTLKIHHCFSFVNDDNVSLWFWLSTVGTINDNFLINASGSNIATPYQPVPPGVFGSYAITDNVCLNFDTYDTGSGTGNIIKAWTDGTVGETTYGYFNVTIDGLTIPETPLGNLFSLENKLYPWGTQQAQRGQIANWVIRNVTLPDAPGQKSTLLGYDSTSTPHDITLGDIYFGTTLLNEINFAAYVTRNSFPYNITISNTITPTDPPGGETTDAEDLWSEIVDSYDESGLIALTNGSDRSATTINTVTALKASQNVIDLWPVYAQADYDATDAKQVEIAKQAWVALMWRRGGSSTTIAEVKWTEVFADDGLLGRLRKMSARGRMAPISNSGVSQKAERTSNGRMVRGWSDRDSLPTNYLPRTKPADNSED